MADKEERIFIFTQQKACDICKKNLEEYDGLTPDCGNCSEKEFPSMTRSETIEKMAKALFEWQRPGCRGDVPIEDVWNNEQEGYEKLAEAALNALLKGVNNDK